MFGPFVLSGLNLSCSFPYHRHGTWLGYLARSSFVPLPPLLQVAQDLIPYPDAAPLYKPPTTCRLSHFAALPTSCRSILTRPLAMTEYRTVYSDRGRLRYVPDHLDDPSRAHRGIFQGRNRRPHRIHIAHVGPDPTLLRCQKPQTTSQSYFTEKLAVPRDHAKRFLRSFIDTHLTPNQEPKDIVTPRSSTSSNRNSVASFPDLATGEMRSSQRNSIGAIGSTGLHRPSITESHRSSGRSSTKSMISSVKTMPEEKPVASGGGVNVNIVLTEPVLFLRGFEQAEHAERNTAMLRGTMVIKVSKPSKLKAITLKFRGRATTKWPEGTLCSAYLILSILNFTRYTTKEDRI